MELLFHRVYEMADWMASLVNACDDSVGWAFEELDWDSPAVSGSLKKFTKTSILAHFCFVHIRLHDLRTARKEPENLEVDNLEAALKSYGIQFISFKDFMAREFSEQQEDAYIELDYLHEWMLSQEEGAFGRLWEKMTD